MTLYGLMILKNETHMTTIKNTLSSMVFAAPLAVAGPSTLPSDACAQPLDLVGSPTAASSSGQSLRDNPWREPVCVKTNRTPTSTSADWYGAHQYNTYGKSSIANLGVTTAVRGQDDGRQSWFHDEGNGPRQPSAAYNVGGRPSPTADGYGYPKGVKYINHAGVDIGLSLQQHSTVDHSHRDKPASLATINLHNGKWTWTQTF